MNSDKTYFKLGLKSKWKKYDNLLNFIKKDKRQKNGTKNFCLRKKN